MLFLATRYLGMVLSPKDEAERWFLQAERDLGFARLGLEIGGFGAQACFVVHQSAEKALKALLYLRGSRLILEDSISELLTRVADVYPQLARYRDMAGRLDQYYLASRYLDSVPGGVPHKDLGEVQAREVVGEAENLTLEIRNIIRVGR